MKRATIKAERNQIELRMNGNAETHFGPRPSSPKSVLEAGSNPLCGSLRRQ